MSLKHRLKVAAKQFGLDVHRYNVVESAEARLFALLRTHRIDTVIDVGANDGGYGRWLRQGGYEGAILSFEPLEDAHGRLVAAARDDAQWHVHPRAALGGEDGTAKINVAANSASSSLLPMHQTHEVAAPESRYIAAQEVPVRRLDGVRHEALDKAGRTLLKIDTQGYEMPVLHGAEQLLPRICGVQLELSLTPLYEGQALFLEVVEWLQKRGFDLWNIIPGFVDPKTARMLQFDGVFFRP